MARLHEERRNGAALGAREPSRLEADENLGEASPELLAALGQRDRCEGWEAAVCFLEQAEESGRSRRSARETNSAIGSHRSSV
jgi:hypothetical protein